MTNLKELEQKYLELGKEIEAAKKYSENWEEITGLDYENAVPSEVNKLDFINGAKWQQEQDKNKYSEEDLKFAYTEGCFAQLRFIDGKKFVNVDEWFEQFKKS